MRKTTTIIAAAAFALPAFAISAPSAAADKFVLDKPHTQILFSIDRGGWTRISGWFEKFDGEVMFDQADVSKSKVTAKIMAESVNTGFAARDRHLRNPDFFNAKEFPEITFESTSITKTGEKTGKMTGDLTLLGVTKPVTLDVTFNRLAASRRNNRTYAGFTATGRINRGDYGMGFGLRFISPVVDIRIEALTVKQ